MTDKPDYMQKARAEFEASSPYCGETLIARGWRLHAHTLDTMTRECSTWRRACDDAETALDTAKAAELKAINAYGAEHAEHEATKAELQALRERVGKDATEIMRAVGQFRMTGERSALARIEEVVTPLLPAPEVNPLTESVKEACAVAYGACAPEFANAATDALRQALTRRGLTIAAIGGKHD